MSNKKMLLLKYKKTGTDQFSVILKAGFEPFQKIVERFVILNRSF